MQYNLSNATLGEKLPILAAPPRFVAPSAVFHFILRMLSLQLLAATWQHDYQQNGDEPGHQKIWFAVMNPQCDSLSVPHHSDMFPMWPYAICEGWLHICPGHCGTDSAM